MGRSVNRAGDVDHDTYDDLIVGSYSFDNNNNNGAAFLVYGPLTGSYTMTGSTCTTTGIACWYDTNTRFLGAEVLGAGDMDADNYDDLIFTAAGYKNGGTVIGAIYPIFGTGQ